MKRTAEHWAGIHAETIEQGSRDHVVRLLKAAIEDIQELAAARDHLTDALEHAEGQRDHLVDELDRSEQERDRLNQIVNRPQADDFVRAMSTEAEYQRQKYGQPAGQGKGPWDWLGLAGHLAAKAVAAHQADNREKYEHHVITAAAACLNWHRAEFGQPEHVTDANYRPLPSEQTETEGA